MKTIALLFCSVTYYLRLHDLFSDKKYCVWNLSKIIYRAWNAMSFFYYKFYYLLVTYLHEQNLKLTFVPE